MRVEPWKLMLGLAGLLVLLGVVVSLGITDPAAFIQFLLFGVLFLALTYAGYRVGTKIGERRAE